MKAHVISDVRGRGREAFEILLRAFCAAPPAMMQIRDKELSDRERLILTRQARSALPPATAVVVNGRPDLAVAAGAQGVHLPSDGLPASDVRRAFPPPFLVGVSCHSREELIEACAAKVDYALYSPIYSGSKEGTVFPVLGPEAVDDLPDPPTLPVFVLGGMTARRVTGWPASRRRKIAGVAGIGLFYDAGERAGEVVEELLTLGEQAEARS